jgi:SAM-dependent methyltransferase
MQVDQQLLSAPQLGEHVWHAFASDPTIADISARHAEAVMAALAKWPVRPSGRPLRFLEVGAYRHHAGCILAKSLGAEVALTDISAAALEDGRAFAAGAGLPPAAALVAADFHDLPFTDGYFDVAFVASSLHHTVRPEAALDELFRVVGAGGLVYVYNEPCERLFCFYQFRSNRAESFTPFERRLHDAGLLHTVSSPFFGSRPEQLFGMIENDRIPVSLYLDRCSHWGERLHTSLTPVRQEIDRWATSLGGPTEKVAREVFDRLAPSLREIRGSMTEVDRLLGFSLPEEAAVRSMARSVAYALAARRGCDEDHWLADFCGAAFQAIVRKKASSAVPGSRMFRRELMQEGGIWRERPEHNAMVGNLGTAILPDLFRATAPEQLEPWFESGDWTSFREESGVHTMLNSAAEPRIALGNSLRDTRALLVARYYAAAGERPYRVCWYADDLLVDDQVLAIAESRMVRASIPRGTRILRMTLRDLGGEPLQFPNAVHLAVLQLIPVETRTA